jgi:hypothetical protein
MYGLRKPSNWHFDSVYKSNEKLAAFVEPVCVPKIDISFWTSKQVQKLFDL